MSFVLPPDSNFLYSLSTFMSACRSILCPIVVLPLFWHASVFKLFSLYMPKQCASVKWTNRCNWPKVCSHGTMATDVTLAVLDSIGSICIKPVASKMMHSVFSIHVILPLDMLLS